MQDKLISKTDLKFYLFITGIVVSFTVAFTSLRKDVEAMTAREKLNRECYLQIEENVNKTFELVICIDKNQAIIMRELGIE